MASRNFVNRRHGVMKKANTLHRLHGGRIAVFLEWNGTAYSYRSDATWPSIDLEIDPGNAFSPDHFETVADRSGSPAVANLNPIPSSLGSQASTSTDAGSSQSDSTTDCSYVTVADVELQALVALDASASYPSSSPPWSEGSSTVSTNSSNPFDAQSYPTPVCPMDAIPPESMARGTKRDSTSWMSPVASGADSTDHPEEPSKRPRRVPARIVRSRRGAQPVQPKEYF